MDINTAFSDPKLETDGVWCSYREGSEVLVARIGAPRFQRMLDAKMRPHRRKEKAGLLDSETENRVLCETMAQTVLLDWRGFKDGTKDFPYSQEAALNLLLRSIDFRNDIAELAAVEDTFRAEELEDDSKN